MAKDVLVTDTLTESMIEAGADLIKKLDNVKANIVSAFWLYFPEEQTWRLIIASPNVDKEGPRKYYEKIVDANNKANKNENILPLNNIGITNSENQTVQLLKIAINTGNSISGIRFSKNTINGVFIDDAYIYRSN